MMNPKGVHVRLEGFPVEIVAAFAQCPVRIPDLIALVHGIKVGQLDHGFAIGHRPVLPMSAIPQRMKMVNVNSFWYGLLDVGELRFRQIVLGRKKEAWVNDTQRILANDGFRLGRIVSDPMSHGFILSSYFSW